VKTIPVLQQLISCLFKRFVGTLYVLWHKCSWSEDFVSIEINTTRESQTNNIV